MMQTHIASVQELAQESEGSEGGEKKGRVDRLVQLGRLLSGVERV